MGCGASTAPRVAWPAPPDAKLRLRPSSEKRDMKVHNLHHLQMGLLRKQTCAAAKPCESQNGVSDMLRSIDGTQDQLDVEEIELEAQTFFSMKSEESDAHRANMYPSLPNRRMHERHLQRIERLQQDLLVDPSLFESIVEGRRASLPVTSRSCLAMPPKVGNIRHEPRKPRARLQPTMSQRA
ncbi:unnamed protein product [Symbiodinium sp. CCMP2456]|nr:unnamed protein product [Symbiodinium sp. CCMP2456]